MSKKKRNNYQEQVEDLIKQGKDFEYIEKFTQENYPEEWEREKVSIETFNKRILEENERSMSAQAYTKISRHLADVVVSADFIDEIQKLRRKYKIPENGFSVNDPHEIEEHTKMSLWPIEWKYIDEDEDLDLYFKIEDELIRLAIAFGLPPQCRVLFDHLVYRDKNSQLNSDASLCYISDRLEERKYKDEMVNDFYYPIAIRVHPGASQNDITDFIKKNYTSIIKPLQEKYEDKMCPVGKTRNRKIDIRQRNDFIYENREKSGKEIASLVLRKFGVSIDHGHVLKIISLERKRRS